MKSFVASLLLVVEASLVAGYSRNACYSSMDRRQWIGGVAASSAAVFGVVAPAQASSPSKLSSFEDPKHGFSLKVPGEWTDSVQELPDRRTIRFWTDPNDSQTFVFIAYTPVRDDFTSLGSFGSVDQVAAQTILPKGSLAGVDIDSTMLSATSEKQAYFFDYRQKVPDVQPMTHYRTIFALQPGATGGAGSVLVTITAQATEERYASGTQALFDDIISSYQKIKT
jgi:hypothetical protein